MKKFITAVCTWGEGPDVLIELDEREMSTEDKKSGHGCLPYKMDGQYVKYGSLCLRKEQARALAYELLNAADQCDELERQLKDYMDEADRQQEEFSDKYGEED